MKISIKGDDRLGRVTGETSGGLEMETLIGEVVTWLCPPVKTVMLSTKDESTCWHFTLSIHYLVFKKTKGSGLKKGEQLKK